MRNRFGNRNRKRAGEILLIIGIIGIAGILCAFWLVLRGVEKRAVKRQDAPREEKEEKRAADAGKTIEIDGTTYTYGHRMETWLFIGTDKSGREDAKGKEYRGSMADFLLLAAVDKTDGTYAFLPINRDTVTGVTMMQTDGSGAASAKLQICTAHWYGGSPQQSCENTVEAVSGLLGGLEIDGYYSLGMDAVPELNRAVGGVEVTVKGDFSKSEPSLREGEKVLLNDRQAYAYVCGRYHVGDETNAQRMERQKQYVEALFDKVRKTFKEDPKFLNELYGRLEDKAVTDTVGRDVSGIISRLADGENRGIFEIAGETGTGTRLGDGLEHAEFYPDTGSLKETMKELYHLEEIEKPDAEDAADEAKADEAEADEAEADVDVADAEDAAGTGE